MKTGRPSWEGSFKEIKSTGNVAIRADFDPETFPCPVQLAGISNLIPRARSALAEYVVLEDEKTGKGMIIE